MKKEQDPTTTPTTSTKLVIAKQTLRKLDDDSLTHVTGGAGTSSLGCPCYRSPSCPA